jgi:WD40 repeat protein
VFISYAGPDKQWADWIAWQLDQAGYRPKLEAWHSVPGRNVVGWIRRELAFAGIVVVILSRGYADSEWREAVINSTLNEAMAGRKVLVPVRVQSCDIPALLESIKRIDIIDLVEDDARQALVKGLSAATTGHAIPTTRPVYPGPRTPPDAPPYPDHLVVRAEKLPLDSVAEICGMRYHWAVTRMSDAREGRSRIGYIEVVGERDGEPRVWPIGVLAHTPEITDVVEFDEQVVSALYWTPNGRAASDLIYMGLSPAVEVWAEAQRRQVRVRSLEEFAGRWDPRRYVDRQKHRLAADLRYPSDLFVARNCTLTDVSGQPSAAAVQNDIFATVRDLLGSGEGRRLLILGGAGSGKSFMLRELTRNLPGILPGTVPMLIDLPGPEREPEQVGDVDALLASHLIDVGEHEADVATVRRMVQRGEIVLLLDGYDDLAARLSPATAAAYLRSLLSALGDHAKIVLAGRGGQAVADRRDDGPPPDGIGLSRPHPLLHLSDLDDGEVHELLMRRYHREALAAEQSAGSPRHPDRAHAEASSRTRDRIGWISVVPGLSRLAANPRLLSFIADLPEPEPPALESPALESPALESPALESPAPEPPAPESPALEPGPPEPSGTDHAGAERAGLAAPAAPSGGAPRPAVIYESLVTRWLEHEAKRRRPAEGGAAGPDTRPLRRAMDELAVRGWGGTGPSGDGPSADDTDPLLGSCGLLHRAPDGGMRFRHDSVREYLVAAWMAAEMAGDQVSDEVNRLLAFGELSPLMVDVICDAVGHADVARWSRSVLAGADGAAVACHNAVSLARRLGLDPAENSDPAVSAPDGPGPVEVMLVPRAAVVTCLAYSGSGIVAAGWGRSVVLLEAGTLRPVRALSGHAGTVRSVAFSSDGRVLASGGDDGLIKLWDGVSGRPTADLGGQTGPVQAMAFSPDAATLMSVGHDGAVRAWRVDAGVAGGSFSGRDGALHAAAFGPGGAVVALACDGGTVRLRDTATGRLVASLAARGGQVRALAFSPDGSMIAGGGADGSVQLWDAGTGRPGAATAAGTASTAVSTVAFAPDGTTVAFAGGDGFIRLWNADAGESSVFAGLTQAVQSVVFAPDGATLVSGGDDHSVRRWETATGRHTAVVAGNMHETCSVVYSPNGAMLATTGPDRAVSLWDAVTGQRTATFAGHRSRVLSMAFAPDSSMLAAGGFDGLVLVWDVATGRSVATFAGHRGRILAVVFTSDGSSVAAGDSSGSVLLWDVASGRRTGTAAGHRGGISSVAFTATGTTVATGAGGSVRLWDLPGGRFVRAMRGGKPACALAFAPDSSTMAACGVDGSTRLWDVGTGGQIATLTGHVGPVRAAAFAPGGTVLATGGDDGSTRLWNAESREPIATLVAAPAGGWAAVMPDGRYKLSGDGPRSMMWLAAGLRRFDIGDLDAVGGHHLAPHVPIVTPHRHPGSS